MRVLSCGKPQEPGTILGMRLCEKMCYNRISIQMPCILMGLMPQRGTSPKVVSLGRLYVWTILWQRLLGVELSYTILFQKPSLLRWPVGLAGTARPPGEGRRGQAWASSLCTPRTRRSSAQASVGPGVDTSTALCVAPGRRGGHRRGLAEQEWEGV